MVVLAPHGEVAKTLPVLRLDTHKHIVSVDTVVGVELLATFLSPYTDPIQQQHDFSHKPARQNLHVQVAAYEHPSLCAP